MRNNQDFRIEHQGLQNMVSPGRSHLSSLHFEAEQHQKLKNAFSSSPPEHSRGRRKPSLQRGLLASLFGAILLTACPVTPPEGSSLGAPTDVVVVPEDHAAVVFWQGEDDPAIAGYNVYRDGIKVNAAPITSGQKAAMLEPRTARLKFKFKRFSFRDSGVTNSQKFKFKVLALGIDGKEGTPSDESSVTPLVCDRMLTRGTDMGAKSQNVNVSRGGANLTDASVTVNGTTIPYASVATRYRGDLPSAVAVGNGLFLRVQSGECSLAAYDWVPEAPVMTAPAANASVNVSSPLNVTWTSSSNPDRFVVRVDDLGNGTNAFTSSDLPNTARNFTIPAASLPVGRTLKVRVYGYNDGTETFAGAFETGSRMAIRNGDEAGRDVITNSGTPSGPVGYSENDPHNASFDGLFQEMHAAGEFDLVQSTTDPFKIQIRTKPVNASCTASYNQAMSTQMNGQKVGIYMDSISPYPLRIGDLGTPTDVPAAGLDFGAGYKIFRDDRVYTFVYPDGTQMVATAWFWFVNVWVYPSSTRAGALRGLFGDFDGNYTNDIRNRGGTVLPQPTPFAQYYGDFVNSWRVPSTSETMFNYYGSETFGGFDVANCPSNTPTISEADRARARGICEAAGVTNPITLEGCITDVALTGDERFAQAAARSPAPTTRLDLIKPDLKANPISPTGVTPGTDLGTTSSVKVENGGLAPAPGTSGTLSPTNGYMIDLILSSDTTVPEGAATASATYMEDMLISRVSSTPDLAPGTNATLPAGGIIPSDTPDGSYYLCTRVDPLAKVVESDESNNVACSGIIIKKPSALQKPDLFIKSATISLGQVCKKDQPVLIVQAEVRNFGNVPSPAALGILKAYDSVHPDWIGTANVPALNPPPTPTEPVITINIPYYAADPDAMEGSHQFKVTINDAHSVDESDFTNNSYFPLNITIPKGYCSSIPALSASITVAPARPKPVYTFTSSGGADTLGLSSSVLGGVAPYTYLWKATKLSGAGAVQGTLFGLGSTASVLWALEGTATYNFLFSEPVVLCQTLANQRVKLDLTVTDNAGTSVTPSSEISIVCPPG
jgi:CARDB